MGKDKASRRLRGGRRVEAQKKYYPYDPNLPVRAKSNTYMRLTKKTRPLSKGVGHHPKTGKKKRKEENRDLTFN